MFINRIKNGWNFIQNFTLFLVCKTLSLFLEQLPLCMGNTWVKDLLHDLSKHPYGFPPAIWLTPGKGKTTITHVERMDLLCKWLIDGVTPENGIQYRKVRVGNGQYNWGVTDISPSFHENAAEHYTAMPDEAELQRIRQRFTDTEYYSSRGYHNRRNR